MRRFVWLMLAAALIVCSRMPAVAEDDGGTVVAVDGVRYALYDDFARIMGLEEGVTSVTVHAEIEGRRTILLEEDADAFPGEMLEEIIFAEGIVTLTPYHGMLAYVRHIALPNSYRPQEESQSGSGFDSFLDYAGYLQMLTLPEKITEEDFLWITSMAEGRYEYTQYEIRDIGMIHGADSFDTTMHRLFRSITIHPDHPTLYDIDGIVFRKGTDELLACLPGRVGAVDVPEGTKAIGRAAFLGCDRLESITLPRSLQSIEREAFTNCGSLRTVQLPPTLEEIGERAFENCLSLTSIVIPDGVTIQAGAFDYCTSLKAVYIQGEDAVIDPSAFLRCPEDLVIYARENSPGYLAAAQSGRLWAEPGGIPVRLPNPGRRHAQPAYVHAADEQALLPLYAAPSDTAKTVATLAVGTTVDVLAEEGGWAHIALSGVQGYLPWESLVLTDPLAQLEMVLSVQAKDGDSKLYAAPLTEAEAFAVETWHRYPVLEQFGAWYLVDDSGTPRYARIADFVSFAMHYGHTPAVIVVCPEGEKRAKVYAQPSPEAEVIGEFYEGTQLPEMDSSGEYVCVLISGREGFIPRDRVITTDAEWFYYEY